MKPRSWPAAAVAVIPGLLVAACAAGGTTAPGASSGGPHASASTKPDVAALRSKIVAAVKQARSVKVSGSAQQGAQSVALDVVLTKAGGIGGTLSDQGHRVAVRTSGRHAYILVSRSMARSQNIPPAACALICGKWLKVSTGKLRSLAGDAGWVNIVAVFERPLAREGVSYDGPATVNGQRALKLSFSGGDGTVYVAAQGTPYPLRIQSGADELNYSGWNTAALPPPPPASKVVTNSQLAGGG